MKNIYQQTTNKSVEFKGVGLHSGKISNVKLIPAEENEGIIFKRVAYLPKPKFKSSESFMANGHG